MACRVEKKKSYDNKNKGIGDYLGTKRQNSFYCDLCKVPGDTQDRCRKIYMYPPKFKNNTWKKDAKIASNEPNVKHTNADKYYWCWGFKIDG